MAYWVGLLWADGCVDSNGVRLGLTKSDADHVRRFAAFAGCSARPLYRNGPTGVEVRIQSAQIATDLARLGVVPRKTWANVAPPLELADRPSFWLGLMDGDGSISWHNAGSGPTPELSFCGSESAMRAAADYLARHTFRGGRPRVYRVRNIYVVSVTGRSAQSALLEMYAASPVALARKRVKADAALAWLPYGRVALTCAGCGLSLQRAKSRAGVTRPYHSSRCRRVVRSPSPPRTPRPMRACENCGNPTRNRRFCRRVCWFAWMVGRNWPTNPLWTASAARAERARQMVADGLTPRDISAALHVNTRAVYRYIRRAANRRVRYGTKLSQTDAASIRQRIVAGEPCKVLAAEHGVSLALIYHIKNGQTWAGMDAGPSRLADHRKAN